MKAIVVISLLIITANLKGYSQQRLYTIEGKTPVHLEGQQVMLFTFKDKKINSVDTALISNGSFHFQSDRFSDGFSIITTGSYPDTVRSVRFIAEPGNIVISLDTISAVGGTPLNTTYQQFTDCERERWRLIMKTQNAKFNNQPYAEEEKQLEKINKSCISFKDFMIENSANILGKAYFKREMAHMAYQEIIEIYPYLDIRIQADPDVAKVFKESLQQLEMEIEKKKLVGTTYKDFTLYTPDGEQKKLSDYVGKSKYVLLDFWASWCGPCIAEMPHLKELYGKYKNQGLEIIGISLDNNKNSWLNAIKKTDTSWIHLSDLKGDNSEVNAGYHIKGIPQSFLIDEKGEIIWVDLRGKIAEWVLKGLFEGKTQTRHE